MSSQSPSLSVQQDAAIALVPKLRFPEFRGEDGWKVETLSDVAIIIMGSSPKSEYYNQVHKGLPFLQGNADIKNRLSAPRLFTSEITKECAISDILLSVRAPVGSVAKSIHHACIGRGIAAVRTNLPNSQEFVYQWLLSYEPLWESISQGGTFDAVNSDDLKGVALAVPKSAEQQEIANCLTSLDDLITAQARKVDALKAHKKGLMQQLFPREGETQPRLRFPEFREAGEWKVEMLEELAKRGSGHTPNKAKEEYYSGPIKWVSLADSKRLDNGLITETAVLISEQGIKNSSAVLHHAGSVILSRDAGVGKSAVMSEPMAVSQHFIVWTCNMRRLSNWFLYYILQNKKPVFENVASGSTIKTIGLPFFKDLRIIIPALVEQQRIASCLTTLDTQITTENQKLETLKTHKKGLMQQLFPAPEEAEQ
jgi:type I restriction enzyme S subunit